MTETETKITVTHRLVSLTPAPPGLYRVRRQDNGIEDSFAEGERIVMVAGVQRTDNTGNTWPSVVLLTADDLSPDWVSEVLAPERREMLTESIHTCADRDALDARVRETARHLGSSLRRAHGGEWEMKRHEDNDEDSVTYSLNQVSK